MLDDRPKHYLKQWRKHAGLTQQQLAEAVDTSKSVISDLENFKLRLSDEWAHGLAEALGTTAGSLFDGSPEETSAQVAYLFSRIFDKEQALKVLEAMGGPDKRKAG